MGILNKLFGTLEGKDKKQLPWMALKAIEQLKEIEEKSHSKTQLIFKHSTRCGISKMVLNQFTDAYDIETTSIDLYYLDLLNYREVSNEVGYRFPVIHQSPQVFIIKNGVAVIHASHGAINEIILSKFY